MAASVGTPRLAHGRYAVDARPAVRCPPGLYDVALVVAPDGGLAQPDRLDLSLSAADLVAIVAQAGATDCDLRVLGVPGEQNLPMLRAVARRLGRDVLIAPTGAELTRVPAAEPPMTDADPGAASREDDLVPVDLVPVDATTGFPVDWLTVQPSGQVGPAFGWFELVDGRVAPRTGPVALPLPDGGRLLATRETFVRARAAGATLRVGHPALVTVGAQVNAGNFVLGYYDRRVVLVDGIGLAAALSALPLYRAQVRFWLRWPAAPADRDRLRSNLADFAEVTGATVWAPDEPGQVVMLDGCLDLAALDALGEVGQWRPYGSAGPFESDLDGRLVPAGGVQVSHLETARLVSGHPARERELAQRSRSALVGPDAGHPDSPTQPFTCDLAVLADGRLAVRHGDGSLLAVGGRQFAQLLRDAGWTGDPVELLSPVEPEQAGGTRRHIADLVAHLGVSIGLDGVTAVAGPMPPPAVPAPAPDPADQRASAPAPAPQSGAEPAPVGGTDRVERALPAADPDRVERALPVAEPDPDLFGPLAGPVGRSRVIDGPPLMPAASTPRHGLSWLPAQPQTNAEQFDLFVACDLDPGAAIMTGVPSPELFLAGHLDADLLAQRTTAAHLLQVRVAVGGAVDVIATDVAPPAAIAPMLAHNDVYVLPPGWLARCQIVATYRVTRDRASVRQSRHTGAPLLLYPAGTPHGVPGLPASAARWPHARLRGVHRYVVVDEASRSRPWLALTADRPAPSDGAVLVQVRVERHQAIDVVATAAALAKLPAIRSIAAELVAGGVDVLLPSAAFAMVAVRKAWRADGVAWSEVTLGRRRRLDAWLEEQRVSPAR